MKEYFSSLNAALFINPIIIARSKDIHEAFIHAVVLPVREPEVNNTEALSQLATSVRKQTTILQQLNNLAEDHSSDKIKKKGVNAIQPSFKAMILAASFTDADAPATTSVTTCSKFVDQRSAVHAKIHLLQTLTHLFCFTFDVYMPLATALFYGDFLWDRPETPKNFCSKLFTKPPPLSPTGAKEAMILHLKA